MASEPVVVHYLDGRTRSGHAVAFQLGVSEFPLRDAATGKEIAVRLDEVKLVCFVKSLSTTGVVRHRETPPVFHASGGGRRAELLFRDGEHMAGVVSLADVPTGGFYVGPLNPGANNTRIYVNPAALVSFRFVT